MRKVLLFQWVSWPSPLLAELEDRPMQYRFLFGMYGEGYLRKWPVTRKEGGPVDLLVVSDLVG